MRDALLFTKVADEQVKKYGYTKKAAEETIRICMDKDILAEYLKEREVEVMDIMTTLFDQDEVTRRYQANRDKEIEKKAEKKGGDERDRKRISDMLSRGKTVQDIADFCGYPVKLIKSVQKSLKTV